MAPCGRHGARSSRRRGDIAGVAHIASRRGATGTPTPRRRAQQLADHDGIRTAESRGRRIRPRNGAERHERCASDWSETRRRQSRAVASRFAGTFATARASSCFERLDVVMPRLERAAIGVSVISRGLDDHARLSGSTHEPMASMGALLSALGEAIQALASQSPRWRWHGRLRAVTRRRARATRALRTRCVTAGTLGRRRR